MGKVKLIPGLISLLKMKNDRSDRIKNASVTIKDDSILKMAKEMHPNELRLKVVDVKDENETVKTYRFQSEEGELPVFQAGQYISTKHTIGKSSTSRAYTISSAPFEAEGKDGYYEIAVRKKQGGFVSNYIFDTWKVGSIILATGPHGDFHYSPLRDSKDIVALAGGAGITPFRSMLKQFAEREPDMKLTLLYGCKNKTDNLFATEIDEICSRFPDRFKRINTYEVAEEGMCQGYVDMKFIKNNVKNLESKTYFICGPCVMYGFLQKEFEKIGNLTRKQLRYEVGGEPDNIKQIDGYPTDLADKTVSITVNIGQSSTCIPANTSESILKSIEKAGLILESRCRSGECGICRSKLISGDVFIIHDNDGRRAVDKEQGYIHMCSTYPLGDLEVMIPPGKAAQT